MKRYMDFLIRSAEKRADHFLNHQVWDKHSRFYGGMSDTVLNVKPTVYALSNVSAVYLNAKSRYYQKEKVLEAIHAALVFIEKNQRMDGSFDFPSCNFHSAPDTSFCFKRLIASYRLFQRFSPDSEYLEIKQTLYRIMERSLHALLYGGFHTPNHRWGIAAALMQERNWYIIRIKVLRRLSGKEQNSIYRRELTEIRMVNTQNVPQEIITPW